MLVFDSAPSLVAASYETVIATEVGDDWLDRSMIGIWIFGLAPRNCFLGRMAWDLWSRKQETLLAGRASRVKFDVLFENLNYLPASWLCSSLTMLD